MRSRLFAAVSVLLLAALATVGQAPAPAPERRFLAVSVLDKDGQPIHGLTADSFRGEYRGQPVKILSATEDTSPRRIAVLLDTSGSGREAADLMWSIAEDLVIKLGPTHSIAVFDFGEGAHRHSQFARDPDGLLRLLREMQARTKNQGGTRLYDAIVAVSKEVSPSGFGDVLYLISDGEDTASARSLDESASAACWARIRVFLVRLPSQTFPFVPGRGRLFSQRFVVVSGGVTLEADRKGDKLTYNLPPFYEAIAKVYRIEVEFHRPADKAREWKLEVAGPDGKKLKDVVVAYPRLLVPLKEK